MQTSHFAETVPPSSFTPSLLTATPFESYSISSAKTSAASLLPAFKSTSPHTIAAPTFSSASSSSTFNLLPKPLAISTLVPTTPPPSQCLSTHSPSPLKHTSILTSTHSPPNQMINHTFRLFQTTTIIDTIASIPDLNSISNPHNKPQTQQFKEFLLLNDLHITPNLTLWLYSAVGLLNAPQSEVLFATQRLLQVLSNLNGTLSMHPYLLASGFSVIDIILSINLFPAFRNLMDQEMCMQVPHLSKWFIQCISQRTVQLVYEKLLHSPACSTPLSTNKQATWPTKVTIDDYNIIRVLGKGCMGKVLLVRHKKSSTLFALKSISKSSVIAHKELDHTLAERKILSTIAQIQHPFLIQCHNAFTSEHELFLVLDFVSGGDMATQLAKYGRLPPNRVQFYACEIVLGLCELHRLGIVYRDLKPENILLHPDGHIVLTDFGLSKMVSPTKNRTKTFAGTAEYLAPEILLNKEYGFEVDWWSFGTLLYEMFCGVTPFWAEHQALMYKRVLEDPLLFPKFMPNELQCLVRGLLERNPTRRFTGPLVQRHVYFSTIDWDQVYAKSAPVPYVPSLRSPMDVSNFEDVFTSMSPRLSPITHDLSASLQAYFTGYSWAPSAPIHEHAGGHSFNPCPFPSSNHSHHSHHAPSSSPRPLPPAPFPVSAASRYTSSPRTTPSSLRPHPAPLVLSSSPPLRGSPHHPLSASSSSLCTPSTRSNTFFSSKVRDEMMAPAHPALLRDLPSIAPYPLSVVVEDEDDAALTLDLLGSDPPPPSSSSISLSSSPPLVPRTCTTTTPCQAIPLSSPQRLSAPHAMVSPSTETGTTTNTLTTLSQTHSTHHPSSPKFPAHPPILTFSRIHSKYNGVTKFSERPWESTSPACPIPQPKFASFA